MNTPGAKTLCGALVLASMLVSCEEPTRPPVPTRIVIARSSRPLNALGDTLQMSAKVLDADGKPMDSLTVVWSSDAANIATVTSAGVVTAKGNGTASISATFSSIRASTDAVVNQLVRTLTVGPSGLTFTALNDTIAFSAVPKDARGNTMTAVTVTWSSSTPAVASALADGRVVALDNGTATITATYDTISGSATTSVDQITTSVVVSPTTRTLAVSDTVRLTAVLRDRRANIVRHKTPTWTTADTNVASVSTSGLVRATGRKLDQVRITGRSDNAQDVATITPELGFLSIAAGTSHTCALAESHIAYCWGTNQSGELGADAYTGSIYPMTNVPIRVNGTTTFSVLSAGGSYTCGLADADQRAWCWGANASGNVGNGESGFGTVARQPVAVSGARSFTTITAGASATCALDVAGAAWCWGSAPGLGVQNSSSVPVAAPGGLVWTDIASGAGQICGISGGNVYCWGANDSGQRGTTGGSVTTTTPDRVIGGLAGTRTAAGNFYSCAVATNNDAYCWGINFSGQLGSGNTSGSFTPVLVVGGVKFTSVYVKDLHSCGLTADGSAYCWGNGTIGQLGNGLATTSTSPVLVSPTLRFTSLSVGASLTCGVTASHAAYCWGSNWQGALGTAEGTDAYRYVPAPVRGSKVP